MTPRKTKSLEKYDVCGLEVSGDDMRPLVSKSRLAACRFRDPSDLVFLHANSCIHKGAIFIRKCSVAGHVSTRCSRLPVNLASGSHGSHTLASTHNLQFAVSVRPACCNLAWGHWRFMKADLNAPFSAAPQSKPSRPLSSLNTGWMKAPYPPAS